MTVREIGAQVLSVVAVLCAATVTGLMVRKELFPAASRRPGITTTQVQNWQRYAATGHRMGPLNAPVTILEFADFECPVCRQFTNHALRFVRSTFPTEVAVVFRHWPLSYHRFAYPSARASECAAAQGRFEQFHDMIYAQQDSLGLKSYLQFAQQSGVRDSVAFARCYAESAPVDVIDADMRAAQDVGGTGTPTILINGLLLTAAPDSGQLEAYVRQALSRSGRGGQ